MSLTINETSVFQFFNFPAVNQPTTGHPPRIDIAAIRHVQSAIPVPPVLTREWRYVSCFKLVKAHAYIS
jgi:hypothetical protein